MRPPLACAAILLLVPVPARAQDLWPEPRTERTVDLEWVRPRVEGENLGTLAGFWRLTVGWPVDPKARLVVVVPYTVADSDGPFGEGGDGALGNIYVGAEIGSPGIALTWRLGGYLPTTPDEAEGAAALGVLGDFDRFEAYLPNTLALRGGFQYREVDPGGAVYGLRAGASGVAPTGGATGKADLVLDYGLLFGVETARLRLVGTVDGRLLVTAGPALSLGDRSIHQVGAELVLLGWGVEPRLILRVPIDDQLDRIGPMVGAGLVLRLGS